MPKFPLTAFLLGAGLGTRLRPLTAECPKPLLPLAGEPMILRAMRQLYAAGTRRFIINTHHCPKAWEQAFPEQKALTKKKNDRQRRRTIQIINSEWMIESFHSSTEAQINIPYKPSDVVKMPESSLGQQCLGLCLSVPNLKRTIGRGRARKNNFVDLGLN